MTDRLTWVVGAGGLLGRRVVEQTRGAVWDAPRISWRSPEAAQELAAAAEAFRAAADGAPWQVAWCAGAGVTATGPVDLAHEVEVFRGLLTGLDDGAGGRLFVSSSAGALYAGSAPAPFDERSPVRPLSPYGEAKVAMEQAAREWGEQTGAGVVLGRIANLYGPGQDVAKPQGLVSQLCRAHLLRVPLSLYVPLDTVRDYLYVDDAARLLHGCLDRAEGVTVKVLASNVAITVGAVLAELRRVSRRTPRIVLATSPQARLQARDLRLRSTVWTDLDRPHVTPLPVGVSRTLQDLARQLQAGKLA